MRLHYRLPPPLSQRELASDAIAATRSARVRRASDGMEPPSRFESAKAIDL